MTRGILEGLGETIVAAATPAGVAAVHVIKVSGNKARRIVDKCFRREGGKKVSRAWRQYLGWLWRGGKPLEKVIVCYMRAPKSYTGEECLEVYCHGGILSRRAVIELMLESGCRQALPGEFTARAYLNGKIDLVQAEAVAMLVTAASEEGRLLALNQVRGGLSSRLERLRLSVLRSLAELEASLDLLVEEGTRVAGRALIKATKRTAAEIERLCGEARVGELAQTGLRCAIIGFSNAGKSTLFNALLGRERTITSPLRGTTRDAVAERTSFEAREFVLVDTAGLAGYGGRLEKLAAGRSRREAEEADVLLLVLDVSRRLSGRQEKVLEKVLAGRKVLVVHNKADLKWRLKERDDRLRRPGRRKPLVAVASRGKGVGRIRRALVSAYDAQAGAGGGLVLSDLQRGILNEMSVQAARAIRRAQQGSEELVAEDLRSILESLACLRGEKLSERVMEEIFSRFCVGK